MEGNQHITRYIKKSTNLSGKELLSKKNSEKNFQQNFPTTVTWLGGIT